MASPLPENRAENDYGALLGALITCMKNQISEYYEKLEVLHVKIAQKDDLLAKYTMIEASLVLALSRTEQLEKQSSEIDKGKLSRWVDNRKIQTAYDEQWEDGLQFFTELSAAANSVDELDLEQQELAESEITELESQKAEVVSPIQISNHLARLTDSYSRKNVCVSFEEVSVSCPYKLRHLLAYHQAISDYCFPDTLRCGNTEETNEDEDRERYRPTVERAKIATPQGYCSVRAVSDTENCSRGYGSCSP